MRFARCSILFGCKYFGFTNTQAACRCAASTRRSSRPGGRPSCLTSSTLGQVGLSYLGPNVMRLSDRMVGLFQAGGFPGEEASDGIGTVISYVVGMGITEAAWLRLARSG